MANFGEDLKREREQRGISLDDIAQQTKVSLRHLRALESGRFDLLPGGVFNRGILHNYLQFLELDEGPWMERFLQANGTGPANAEKGGDWLRYAQTLTGAKPSPPGEEDVRFRWLGVLLLFLLLCAGAWLIWLFAVRHWQRDPTPPTDSPHALLYSGYVFDGQAAPPDHS